MIETFRKATLALIALVMVLTAQTAAGARGMARVDGQMVICAGGEVVTVFVDETGKPVGAPHVCPDYLVSLLSVVAAPPVAVLRPVVWTAVEPVAVARQATGRSTVPGKARDPPAA